MARYQSVSRRDDTALEGRMQALAQQYPRYGYLNVASVPTHGGAGDQP